MNQKGRLPDINWTECSVLFDDSVLVPKDETDDEWWKIDERDESCST